MNNFLKVTKKIFLLIIVFYIIFSQCIISEATEGAAMLKKMESQASSFIQKGSQNLSGISYQKIAKEFVGLGQILTMIGIGVMVGVCAYMGIRYLTAGPEAQAKLKVQLIGVLVSGMVIFGGYSIWKIVIQIASTF